MSRLLASTLVLATAVILQAQAKLPTRCDRNATVAVGDTCNSISAQYNVSTYQLTTVNKGIINSNCTNLLPDEVLCLGITGEDCRCTHVVRSGDSCYSISIAHNVSESTIAQNNPNTGPNCEIYPDEVLCVSSTVIHYNSTNSTSSY